MRLQHAFWNSTLFAGIVPASAADDENVDHGTDAAFLARWDQLSLEDDGADNWGPPDPDPVSSATATSQRTPSSSNPALSSVSQGNREQASVGNHLTGASELQPPSRVGSVTGSSNLGSARRATAPIVAPLSEDNDIADDEPAPELLRDPPVAPDATVDTQPQRRNNRHAASSTPNVENTDGSGENVTQGTRGRARGRGRGAQKATRRGRARGALPALESVED